MPTSKSARSNLARGYPMALLSALFLSTTAIFIRHLTQTYQLPALVLALWRDIFVVLTLIPVLGVLRPALLRVDRRHLGYLAGHSRWCWQLSMRSGRFTVAANGAAVATVLVYCWAG